jgi:mono/diheme cytochrome c family protein
MSNLHKERWWPFLLLASMGAGCPGRPTAADRTVPADQIHDFGTLFAMRCAGCHGADGKLGPAPPLNDPLFLAIVPDVVLLRIITEGRAVTHTQQSPMPAFGLGKNTPLTDEQAKAWAELKAKTQADPKQQAVLTETQIEVLAKGIKLRWKAIAPADTLIPPYFAPTNVGGGNKEEGARVFARACAGCHGSFGHGGKNDERRIGPINDPAFLALISDQALRRYAITGRPDLGMPAFDGKAGRSSDFRPLTSAEINDLVALLAVWRLGRPANDK